jgi:hypothetical protein
MKFGGIVSYQESIVDKDAAGSCESFREAAVIRA